MKKLILMFIIIICMVGYAVESQENMLYLDPTERLATKIIYCESGGRHEGLWGAAGEYGWCQIKRPTFNWMKGLADRPELKWKNKDDQVWLMKWAIKNNLSFHWTCWKKIKKREGGFV